jgi:hypothetical protein
MDHDTLAESFAERVVDGMDVETLAMLAIEHLRERFRQMPTNDLVDEVMQYYPELLEEN